MGVFDNSFKGLERMKISIISGQWWGCKHDAHLGLDAMTGIANVEETKKNWQQEDEGEVVPWNPSAWSCVFKKIASLKVLVLELENFEYKKEELKAIVTRARKWIFPAYNDNLEFVC